MLKVYLTDLAAYNKGTLFGEWVTLPLDEEELSTAVDKVLRGGEAICAIEYGYEKHEEYFLTDYEWDEQIELFDVDEYVNLSQLNKELQSIDGVSIQQLKALQFLLSEGFASNLDDALTKLDDVIIHENQTMEDVAYNLMQELYGVDMFPSIIANHIDYAAIARDLEIDGNYTVTGDDVFEYVG
jgi:antirestriction protein